MAKKNKTVIIRTGSANTPALVDRRRFLTTLGKTCLSVSCFLTCPFFGCDRVSDVASNFADLKLLGYEKLNLASDNSELSGDLPENKNFFFRPPSTELHPFVCQYYETISGSRVRCLLCPHGCILKNGQRGICGVRKNQDGRLMNLAYGKIMVYVSQPGLLSNPFTVYFIDKPFLQIGSVGCPLRCSFCIFSNASFSRPEHVSLEYITPQETVALAIRNKSIFIGYSINEMTVNYEHTIETARLARENGIGNGFSTCGYLNPEPFKNLMQYMDWVFFSIKGTSDDFYRKYTTGRLAPVLNNLKILGELNIPTEIFYVLIPNLTDSQEHIKIMAAMVKDFLGPYTPVHFIRYVPANKLSNVPPIPLERIEEAMWIARQNGLKYVVPWVHAFGLDRRLIAHKELTRMVCPFCGKTVFQFHFTPEGVPDRILLYNDGYHCQWCGNQIYKVNFPT